MIAKTPRGPRRKVLSATEDEATTGLLRGRRRTKRWWNLRLECGHLVERPVQYSREVSRHVYGGGRAVADLLPAPSNVWCDECAAARE